jgi:hypothetical protein
VFKIAPPFVLGLRGETVHCRERDRQISAKLSEHTANYALTLAITSSEISTMTGA